MACPIRILVLWSAIHLHLRQDLLQPALLRRSHVGKLINIYKKVVGECHLGIKLVIKLKKSVVAFVAK